MPVFDMEAQEKPLPGFADVAQRAKQARKNDQLDLALNLYRPALEQRQSWVEGWWDLGSVQYKLRR